MAFRVSLNSKNTLTGRLLRTSGSIIVDAELSPTSQNPVQNKAVDAALKELDNRSVAYRTTLTSADNMHALSYPGIYYAQRSGGFPSNFPAGFADATARILVIKSATPSSHYGETHFVMDSNGLWIERYTLTNTWTDWMRVANLSDLESVMMQRSAVQTDTDLDDLNDSGYYLLYSGHSYAHAPSFYTGGSAWCFVFDFTTSSSAHFRVQLFMRVANKVWALRTFNTSSGVGTWGDWVTYDDKFTALYGKKISIVGDSISSYNGYNPSGYAY